MQLSVGGPKYNIKIPHAKQILQLYLLGFSFTFISEKKITSLNGNLRFSYLYSIKAEYLM